MTVGGTVTGFTVNGAEVTILDDDEPAITLTFPDGGSTNAPFLAVDEDDGTLTITLKAETAGAIAPTRDFDVRLRVVDTPDSSASSETGDIKPFDKTYTFTATDFTLASGQYSHTVSKALEIIDDDTVEKIKKLFVGIDRGHARPPRHACERRAHPHQRRRHGNHALRSNELRGR